MKGWPILMLLWLALPVRAASLPESPTPTFGPSALVLEVQVQGRVEEGRILFQEDLRWTLPTGVGQVRLDGVPLPLFFPAVGDPPLVLDRGILPAATQSVEIATTEDDGKTPRALQLQRKGESLLLAGAVVAGKAETVRVQYAVPLSDTQLRLGLSGRAAGRTWLSVAIVGSPPVRLTLALDRPGRTSRFEEGREHLVGASLTQALTPNDIAMVTLSDLPAPARRPGRALAWFAAFAALTGLAALAGRRGKAAEPAP